MTDLKVVAKTYETIRGEYIYHITDESEKNIDYPVTMRRTKNVESPQWMNELSLQKVCADINQFRSVCAIKKIKRFDTIREAVTFIEHVKD